MKHAPIKTIMMIPNAVVSTICCLIKSIKQIIIITANNAAAARDNLRLGSFSCFFIYHFAD